MTSNLGAQYLSELPPDQPSSVARDDVMRVVRAHFAPEFINRQVLLRLLLACVCMRMCVCLTMIVSARASLCALLSVCAPSSPSPSHPSLPPSLPLHPETASTMSSSSTASNAKTWTKSCNSNSTPFAPSSTSAAWGSQLILQLSACSLTWVTTLLMARDP